MQPRSDDESRKTSSGIRLLMLITLTLLSACQPKEQDPGRIYITGAEAHAAPPTSTLGGQVEPDKFVIKAEIATTGQLNSKDWFFATLEVGTQANRTKYGGASIKFTADRMFNWFAMDGKNHYIAWSDPDQITCNEQNKLVFRISGDGRDDLMFRLRTPASAIDQNVFQKRATPTPGNFAMMGQWYAVNPYWCLTEGGAAGATPGG